MNAADEPGAFARIKERLAAALRAGARVQAAVLLTVVYYLVVGPAALLARLLGFDPLARGGAGKTGWHEREPRDPKSLLRSQG